MDSPASWLSKWARSPRQDRRVIEDGKFVELGKVHVPEPLPVEEQAEVNAALEVVHEPVNTEAESASGDVPLDATNGSSEGGLVTGGESDVTNPSETVGTTEEVPVSSVSTETREAADGGVVTMEEITRGEKVLDAVLTEEQSDAMAETLRLPDDIPF